MYLLLLAIKPPPPQDPVSTSAKDRLASDVLWSDPILEPGLRFNEGREIGCVFGPDMTERFLRENGLRCVIRSHEGPDARANREDNMPSEEEYTRT